MFFTFFQMVIIDSSISNQSSSLASLMIFEIYVSHSSLVPATPAPRLPGSCFLVNALCANKISHCRFVIHKPETLYISFSTIVCLSLNHMTSSSSFTIIVFVDIIKVMNKRDFLTMWHSTLLEYLFKKQRNLGCFFFLDLYISMHILLFFMDTL